VDKPLIFIGLNSSLYYDEQIFALAHEIFHFKTKSGKAYSLEKDDEDARTEKKADRFAAELLLPETVLRTYVINEFSNESISDDNVLRILRFIANLQVVWWLPYKSIVLRLREEKLIDEELFNKLYEDFDVRDENSEYYTILKAIDKNAAIRLNNPTGNLTVSNEVIRTILKNYDDEYISEDEFVELLGVFKLEPSDYGYQIGDFDADCDIEGE
jgi:Zn-dependent peptidase ImmA (M78 family)